jgi:hypothetical protein
MTNQEQNEKFRNALKELRAYNQQELPQQETLYTEEQVRKALSESFKASQEGYNITSNEIIQSLKQTKKD